MTGESSISQPFGPITSESAGETHRAFMREVRAAFAESNGDSLQTAVIGLNRLQTQGLIKESEVESLRRTCEVVFQVAHGEGDREQMCSTIQEIHQQIVEDQSSSEVAFAIVSIAANVCTTEDGSEPEVLFAASQSNTVDGGIVGGVIAGAVIGGAIGGVGGAIAGAVIGGIAGGAATIGATKD